MNRVHGKTILSFSFIEFEFLMKKTALLTLLTGTLTTGKLLAHPGHGNPEVTDPALHYLTEPFHYLPWLVAGFLVATAIYYWRSSRSRD